MDDKDTFPIDFDEWEKTAESGRATAKREGVVGTPVFLDPDEFITFCNEQKISPNSAARAKFVIEPGGGKRQFGHLTSIFPATLLEVGSYINRYNS